jgi:N-acetylglucosaminyldiphosphoundecaprenol N-acetyl-beta-D-mannosaminyltransferase
MTSAAIQRIDVLGVGISAINMDIALAQVTRWVEDPQRCQYVCVTGVHGVMESQRDPELLRIHNESGMTTPDGMPMVWAGRHAGARWMSRVYGPDLMLAILERASERGWKSFLFGGKPGVPERLAKTLTDRIPNLDIVGTCSPPFRDLTPDEDLVIVEQINSTGADLVWVGLSTPRQERWMATHADRLRASVLFGVGAAFDIHAGTLPQAPVWMQRSGLEWAFRLAKEPRRLAKRYLRNNPAFVWGIMRRPPFMRANSRDGDSMDPEAGAAETGEDSAPPQS